MLEATIEMLKQKARDSWPGDTGEQRAKDLEMFLRKMLKDYSEKLGLSESDILTTIEGKRDYSAINYYQEANFPSLDGVKIFATQADLKAAVPSMKFRCPSCNGISTNPYTCNSGVVKDGKVCDWKSYGLFGTLGKGLRATIKEGFLERPRIDEIFMPIEFENIKEVLQCQK